MGVEVQPVFMVSTDTTEAGGNTIGISLLASGNENPASLLDLLYLHHGGGIGVPHYNLMRVEIYAPIWSVLACRDIATIFCVMFC